MDIVVCSLYYDSFPKIRLKKMQYIALCTAGYCSTSLYRIVTPVSSYVSYRHILANTQPGMKSLLSFLFLLLFYYCSFFAFPDDKNPCHLAEAPGPCRGLVMRYFFDSNTQQCKHFFYGGCFGNANNFRSLAQCQAKCLNPGRPG